MSTHPCILLLCSWCVGIPYRTIPYHTVPYRTMPFHAITNSSPWIGFLVKDFSFYGSNVTLMTVMDLILCYRHSRETSAACKGSEWHKEAPSLTFLNSDLFTEWILRRGSP